MPDAAPRMLLVSMWLGTVALTPIWTASHPTVAWAQAKDTLVECYPGGWPVVVLPVEVVGDSANLPFSRTLVQDRLLGLLLEFSPFTQVESVTAGPKDRERHGWFHLRARILVGPYRGFGSKDKFAGDLIVTIWASENYANVFEGRYSSRHHVTDASEEWRRAAYARAGTAVAQLVLEQWIGDLLPDLNRFFNEGAWDRATEQWKARHGPGPGLLVVLPTGALNTSSSVLEIAGQTLSDRGCAAVVFHEAEWSAIDAGEGFPAELTTVEADYVLIGAARGDATGRTTEWWLWHSSTRSPVLHGRTNSLDRPWQVTNAARAVAARIGTYLHPLSGGHPTD